MIDISTYTTQKIWVAMMEMRISDYSKERIQSAIQIMKDECARLGVETLDHDYIFMTMANTDTDSAFLCMGVKQPGLISDILIFAELAEELEMLHIEAQDFADLHDAMADWMYENNYEAGGELRHMLHDKSTYIYECPIKSVAS